MSEEVRSLEESGSEKSSTDWAFLDPNTRRRQHREPDWHKKKTPMCFDTYLDQGYTLFIYPKN